jgi:carbamoyltransferase
MMASRMNILGLSATAHDNAAALVQDGRLVVAAEEERFTRRKHAVGQLPHLASRFCLDFARLELDDVDYVTVGFGPWSGERMRVHERADVRAHQGERMQRLFPPELFRRSREPALVEVNHHLAHAASAFRCSGFPEAAILVIDGRGEDVATTVAVGRDSRIDVLRDFDIAHSLGLFYAAVAHHVGLPHFGEGKAMGLAPLGRPVHAFEFLVPTDDGYTVRWDRTVPGNDRQSADGDCTGQVFQGFSRLLERRFGAANAVQHRLDAVRSWRRPEVEFPPTYRDIAASAQRCLEDLVVHLARLALRWTRCDHLVLAGGVAQNCVMNGRLARESGARGLFVQPAAHDAGTSLGAALELAACLGEPAPAAMRHAAWGPQFSSAAVDLFMREIGVDAVRCDRPAERTARLLAEGSVVAWVRGRMEFGPRALGNRSILSSPAVPGRRDHLNRHVKHREAFRPFALAVRDEDHDDLLETPTRSPFMLVSTSVRPRWRDLVAEGIHVDGSTRPQTVSREDDPAFWEVLTHFRRLTGIPALINTSFNDSGEPLVCSPWDAIRTFSSTAIDHLVMEDHLISKRPAGAEAPAC